jgi:hypothetical protein
VQSCSIYTSPVPISDEREPVPEEFIGEWELTKNGKSIKGLEGNIFITITDTKSELNGLYFFYSKENKEFQDSTYFTLFQSEVENKKILSIEFKENSKKQFHFSLYKLSSEIQISMIDEANFLDSLGKPKVFFSSDSLKTQFSNILNQKSSLEIWEHFVLKKR